MIYEYIDFVMKNGYFDYRRNEQSKFWMYETINEQLRLHFYNDSIIRQQLQQAEHTVLTGQQTSFVAAQQLLDTYYQTIKK
jgi:LAO/AO transport system kinase